MMPKMTKRCKNPRCNAKFKTTNANQEFCRKGCATQFAYAKPEEFLEGKRVLFMAKGAKEDGLHPNERPLVPRQSFAVGQQ